MQIAALFADASRRSNLWLAGCGGMGGALLARWLEAGLPHAAVTVIDPSPGGLPAGFAGRVAADAAAAAATGGLPDILVLGIKPQLLTAVAAEFATLLERPPILVSMLAGVRSSALAVAFPGARIVRIMPNMPARIGMGVTAIHSTMLGADEREFVGALMAPAGKLVWLEDEGRFDAVTAVSGSGPAYLFRFIEALAGAGESAGLDAQTAATLAFETVVGAAALAAQSEHGPAALRQQVTSPNGTTQAGLDVLDGDGALSSLLRATVRAAAERSRALAAAAEAAADSGQVREAAKVP